jgi:DNA-binding NarL/FixJ family response regulator
MVGCATPRWRATQAMPHLKTYIVEDSPVIRENLIATLEEMVPLDVVGTADDESTATYWLGRPDNACDLVIIDVFLKQGSGLGVLQALRHSAAPPKRVVLSNYATPDMRRKCLQLGADEVFDKSNEIDGLISYCMRLAGDDPGPVPGAA